MVEIRVIFPLLLLVAGVTARSGQPNVLLIIVDDLRPALGCYDDPLAFTPHIDALASRGTVFTRAYAQQALCGPSRTSFLTSRRPDTTRLYDVHSYWRRHAGNFTSLPQYFRERGYHAAAAGKVFHPGIVSNHSDDQPYSWSETPFHPPTQAHKQDPVCLGSDGALHTNIYCPVQVEDQPGGSLPDIETTRYSTAWLQEWAERGRGATRPDQQHPTQPFFLAVGYHKPHIPLKFPKEFLELFPISSVPLAPNRWLPKGLPPVAWNPWNDMRSREDIAALNVSFPYGPMPDYYARYIRQGYYAATSYTDSLIGDLLDTVDRLFPDTIVAFIGDHGWSLGEHQEWSKFSNFEVSTRVPFIVRDWDGAQRRTPHTPSPRNRDTRSTARKGVEYGGLVELVDLFPTLVDLAGLPAIPQCPNDSHKVQVCTEGVSLSHIVRGDLRKLEGHSGNGNTDHGRDGGDSDEAVDSKDVESSAIFSYHANLDHMGRLSQSEAGDQTVRPQSMNHGDAQTTRESGSEEVGGRLLESVHKRETTTESLKSAEKSIMPLVLTGGKGTFSKAVEHEIHTPDSIQKKESTTQSLRSAEESIKPIVLTGEKGTFSKVVEHETHTPDPLQKKESTTESTESAAESIKPLVFAVKKAAFSQYPRPGPTPSRDPDSDQPHTRDTTIMGYSIRTNRFRFTAWLRFDNATYRPDWDHVVAEELYDHKVDPSEDRNVVGKRSYARRREALYSVLRGGWRSAVRWR